MAHSSPFRWLGHRAHPQKVSLGPCAEGLGEAAKKDYVYVIGYKRDHEAAGGGGV